MSRLIGNSICKYDGTLLANSLELLSTDDVEVRRVVELNRFTDSGEETIINEYKLDESDPSNDHDVKSAIYVKDQAGEFQLYEMSHDRSYIEVLENLIKLNNKLLSEKEQLEFLVSEKAMQLVAESQDKLLLSAVDGKENNIGIVWPLGEGKTVDRRFSLSKGNVIQLGPTYFDALVPDQSRFKQLGQNELKQTTIHRFDSNSISASDFVKSNVIPLDAAYNISSTLQHNVIHQAVILGLLKDGTAETLNFLKAIDGVTQSMNEADKLAFMMDPNRSSELLKGFASSKLQEFSNSLTKLSQSSLLNGLDEKTKSYIAMAQIYDETVGNPSTINDKLQLVRQGESQNNAIAILGASTATQFVVEGTNVKSVVPRFTHAENHLRDMYLSNGAQTKSLPCDMYERFKSRVRSTQEQVSNFNHDFVRNGMVKAVAAGASFLSAFSSKIKAANVTIIAAPILAGSVVTSGIESMQNTEQEFKAPQEVVIKSGLNIENSFQCNEDQIKSVLKSVPDMTKREIDNLSPVMQECYASNEQLVTKLAESAMKDADLSTKLKLYQLKERMDLNNTASAQVSHNGFTQG